MSLSFVDLTLPLVDEKAALPAIIVTPSSPSGDTDFSIAFLAPPPSPPLIDRISTAFRIKKQPQVNLVPQLSQFKARTVLLIFLPIVLLVCHLLTHQLAVLRQRLSFETHTNMQYSTAPPEANVHAVRVGMGGMGFGMEGRGEQTVRVALVAETGDSDST